MNTSKKGDTMSDWSCVLELDSGRSVIGGSPDALCKAVRRGADLRVYMEFRNNEHLDPASDSPELLQEASEFRVTYLLDNRWVAGIMSLRQPVSLPDGFGPRPSMSCFLYNQDGGQAIARPFLDGGPVTMPPGPSPLDDHSAMPKYHQFDNWDAGTNAPSHNFVYDFDVFRYFVCDRWREALAHEADGTVVSGSVEALTDAFVRGRGVKVGIRGICADLADEPAGAIEHELFVETHSAYYYTEQQLFIAGTHPVIRVAPNIPLCYRTRNWDYGWLLARTDGFVARLRCDPYTLRFSRSEGHYAVRWFVSEAG